MKNKKSFMLFFVIIVLFFVIFKIAYSSNSSKSTNELDNSNKSSEASTINSKASTKTNSDNSTKTNSDTSQEKSIASNDKMKDKVYSEQDITEIKDYIINGQENKPEAQKIKWSETFLNRVDIKSLYKQYIAKGGATDDLESFANYMTLNAPIQSDWENLFKKDLHDTYGENVVRLEHLKDDSYQAYIVKDGSEIPYVVVSSRTGYFHG